MMGVRVTLYTKLPFEACWVMGHATVRGPWVRGILALWFLAGAAGACDGSSDGGGSSGNAGMDPGATGGDGGQGQAGSGHAGGGGQGATASAGQGGMTGSSGAGGAGASAGGTAGASGAAGVSGNGLCSGPGCQNDANCPPTQPAEGTSCGETGACCHYCDESLGPTAANGYCCSGGAAAVWQAFGEVECIRP